jgi:hypothetical protein
MALRTGGRVADLGCNRLLALEIARQVGATGEVSTPATAW